MSKEKNFTGGERVGVAFFTLCLYAIVGLTVIGILGDVFGVIPRSTEMTTAEFIGSVALWPFFFIKYLAIGLWAVVSSGFSLLF